MSAKKLLNTGIALAGLVVLGAVAYYLFRAPPPQGATSGVTTGQTAKGAVAQRRAARPAA